MPTVRRTIVLSPDVDPSVRSPRPTQQENSLILAASQTRRIAAR
ncbi:hypothetical protein [Novacetimonas maltaceti]|nr:hypothetical protein [Novacetimonas maltaceti]